MLHVNDLPGLEMIGSYEDQLGRERIFGLELANVAEDATLTAVALNDKGEPVGEPFEFEDDGTTMAYLERNWLYPPIQLRYRLFNGKLVEVVKVKKPK